MTAHGAASVHETHQEWKGCLGIKDGSLENKVARRHTRSNVAGPRGYLHVENEQRVFEFLLKGTFALKTIVFHQAG
jgi:hypothetical protein